MQFPLLQVVYCCDADAIINISRAGRLNSLRAFARAGGLKIPKGIYAEIGKRSEAGRRLQAWDKDGLIVVDLDHEFEVLRILPEIENKYGPPFKIGGLNYEGFWKGGLSPKSKDAQVVALAKVKSWIVVSGGDRCVKAACLQEDVQSVTWEELARLAAH